MIVAIIAALTQDRVIGKGGRLPWHIPEDLKRFKQLTTEHAILMGRKTYESLGRQLPNRRNVVLSSREIPGVETYPSIPEAMRALQEQEKIFVVGGGKVYAQLMDRANLLYLTIVDQEIDGDTFFPPYEHLIGIRFRLLHKEEHNGFTFMDYVRITGDD